MLILVCLSFLTVYLIWILLTPQKLVEQERKKLDKEYDKPFKASSKSNWEKLPNSPQLNTLRSQWQDDKIDLVSFLMEIENLFKLRVEEVADWSKVDPWTDRLEPSEGYKEWKKDKKKPNKKKPNKIDQLDLTKKPVDNPLECLDHQQMGHGYGCPCMDCLEYRTYENQVRRKIAEAYAIPPHQLWPDPIPAERIPALPPAPVPMPAPSDIPHVTSSGRMIEKRHSPNTCGSKYANLCARCGYSSTSDRPMTLCPRCDSLKGLDMYPLRGSIG